MEHSSVCKICLADAFRTFLVRDMIDDLQAPSADGLYKYVDDTTIYEVVRKNIASQAQTIVDEISRWSNQNKFELHPKKCKELRISFSRLPTDREPVHIDESIVALVTSAKILGVHLQNSLKWNSHIDATVKKAAKRLYFLVQLKRAKVPSQEL